MASIQPFFRRLKQSSQIWVPLVLLSLIGVAIYGKTIGFDFTNFDDRVLIVLNFGFIRNLGNIPAAFQQNVFHFVHGAAVYYRPLLTLSFMTDVQWSGQSPWGYHLTNLVIHLLTGSLIYLLLRKLNHKAGVAFLIACLFIVHPVLTQAVAWIPGRNDSMLALIVVATFLVFQSWLEHPGVISTLILLVLSTLAFFCKESGLLLPVMLLLDQVMLSKRKPWDKYSIIFYLALLTILVGYWFARTYALQDTFPVQMNYMVTSLQENMPVIVPFLGQIVFPFKLQVLPILKVMNFVYGYAAIAVISVVILWGRNKNWRRIGFGLVWFIVFLLPAIVKDSPTNINELEHRLYLPLIGLLLVLVELPWIKNFSWLHTPKSTASDKLVPVSKLRLPTIAGCLAAIMLVGLGAITFCYADSFKNADTFWTKAVQTTPNYDQALMGLGATLEAENKLDQAKIYLTKALAINPMVAYAHFNLGILYQGQNDYFNAMREYIAETQVDPTFDQAHYHLGEMYYLTGHLDDAKLAWKNALTLNPSNGMAYVKLHNLAIETHDSQLYAQYQDVFKSLNMAPPTPLTAPLSAPLSAPAR